MRASFITPPVCASRAREDFDRLRMIVDRNAERLGDGVGGDVVVRRPDAAGGENVSVACAQRIERGDDFRLFVRHDADFLEVDADGRQILGDKADILVLGAAGENLIADDQKSGRDDLVLALTRPLACAAHQQTLSAPFDLL